MTFEYRLDHLQQVAQQFWQSVPAAARVFAIYGTMGAGKTTTVAALCSARGVREAVSSPTFSIINEYSFYEEGHRHSLYHMDLYRLRDADEARSAGVEDALDSGSFCFVEWPEIAPALFDDAVRISIEIIDEQTRRITIKM